MDCDILKSKLILCEWNAFHFIEIAFIGFTLHEIKQCIVFFGTPGSCCEQINIKSIILVSGEASPTFGHTNFSVTKIHVL